jgi:PKHD-type hydroxylase
MYGPFADLGPPQALVIRSAEQREILFDLENARRDIFDAHGKTPAFDQLSKCSANLLRIWVDD